jgi:hypothetical protein
MLPFGALVEATHAGRREPLALLILSDELARDQRLRGLLRLEVARAGGLRHPSVARPIEVGDHDRRLYVVYERPRGEPLSRWIDDQHELSADVALTMIRQLAEGLDAAHGRRLAHGALGTGAILTRSGETVTLLGIGVLAAIDEAGLSDTCRPGSDSPFAAPEKRAGRLAVPSADGFALGQLARGLIGKAEGSRAGDLAPAIRNVLDRQANGEPSARFRTCTALANALADARAPAVLDQAGTRPPEHRVEHHSGTTPPTGTVSPVRSSTETRSAPPTPTARSVTVRSAPSSAERAPAPASSRSRRPEERPWRQDGASRVRTLDATPAMRDAVHTSLRGVLLHVALASGPSLFLLLLALTADEVVLLLVAVGVLVLLRVPPAVVRAIRLSRARQAPEIVQVLGPARAVEHHVIHGLPYPRSHRLEIGEIGVVTISGEAFGQISAVGAAMHVSLNAEGEIPAHDQVFDLPALVTYSRTGDLLLEVRRPDGELIYADPAYAAFEG